jgi:hypothetical protein
MQNIAGKKRAHQEDVDSDYLFANWFRQAPAPTGLTPNCIRVLVERDSASGLASHVQNMEGAV